MKYAARVRPVSHLKANPAEVIREPTECRGPMVIAQNGEARLVVQDLASCEQSQQTLPLALLKLLTSA